MADRRTLTFNRLDDVMPEVDRLVAGYEAAGAWSLGQICQHLAMTFDLLITAGPVQPPSSARLRRFEPVRVAFLELEKYPDGVEVPLAALAPTPGLDDHEKAELLRAAIIRYGAYSGPLPAHPYLGPLTRDEWLRFHCLHTAHHLGFVVPNSGEARGVRG